MSNPAASADSDLTPRRIALWPAGAVVAAAAAGTTTVIAIVGRALGAPLAIDGEPISLIAFPVFTLIATLIGLVLAVTLNRRARKPRRAFMVTTVALTALSLMPDLVVSVTAGSKVVLMLSHLAAAAIVIPAVSRRLPEN
jgi:hypothetical protein